MSQRLRALGNLVIALLVTSGVIAVVGGWVGGTPLGAALSPVTGVWTSAADAQLPTTSTMHMAGLVRPTSVIFDAIGVAHIQAQTDHDLFWTMGYLQARFRLFQMDLLRRQGEGGLSEIVGQQALPSDTFFLQLGLLRTAEQEWQAMQRAASPVARDNMLAYTAGVNARLADDIQQKNLPLMVTLLGYQPRPWTPVDTLVIQGDMAEDLTFTDTPLSSALLVDSLGYQRVAQWFPVLPANAQFPYDPAPYAAPAALPMPAQSAAYTSARAALATLAHQLAALPRFTLHTAPDSNNWAVDGTRTASGKALLAGDPHLHQTLPAIWYQMTLDSPSYHASGVGIPGTPAILIGHNQHIAWSLTDTQNQTTFYYIEKTAPSHPHQYFWRGAWHAMTTVSYTIPVKGGASVHLSVDMTVHGPVMADDRAHGQTVSVDWMGAIPSLDVSVLYDIMRASTYNQFHTALSHWLAPTQNFVYADDRGNIGMIGAGLYPVINSATPWLPLPGTGEADVIGSIPYAAIPQVYNPPSHVVYSANQRPVGPNYPYYIGTSANFFDDGYRAAALAAALSTARKLTVHDMENLQNDVHDTLAQRIVPHLLAALHSAHLNAHEQAAAAVLSSWDDQMTTSAAGATLWWTTWQAVITDTFQPWWTVSHVPTARFPVLTPNVYWPSLNQDLETWILHDPHNAAFSPPHQPARSAADVLVQAFRESVAQLSSQLGGAPATWQWGRVHQRVFDSLAAVPSLGYGPFAGTGDSWTLNAADGPTPTSHGPSWRFIMDWSTGMGEGVYPGGQSENPASAWYTNQIAAWRTGQYYPMLSAADAQQQLGHATWTLQP